MSNLNYNELLQTEIDKVQGYVEAKTNSIFILKTQLEKDEEQLVELQAKLNELLEEQKTFTEFIKSKEANAKSTKGISTRVGKKEDVTTEGTVDFQEAVVKGIKE